MLGSARCLGARMEKASLFEGTLGAILEDVELVIFATGASKSQRSTDNGVPERRDGPCLRARQVVRDVIDLAPIRQELIQIVDAVLVLFK